MNKLATFLVAAAFALALAACSDGNGNRRGNNDGAQLGVAPALGVIYNAPVRVYRAAKFDPAAANNDSARIDDEGSLNTGTDGLIEAGSLDAADFPVLIEVELTDATSYYDESALSQVNIPASLQGTSLHALVPAPQDPPLVAVTLLTEIAYQAAVAQGRFPLDAAAVNELNETVRNGLAPELDSLLSPATPFDSNTTTGSLGANPGGRYALLLAGLAQLGAGQDAPGLRAALDLLADLADDGKINGSSAPNGSYSDNFAGDLQTALQNQAMLFGSQALQTETAGRAPVTTVYDFSAQPADESDGDDGGANGNGGDDGEGDGSGGTGPITVPANSVWRVDVSGTVTSNGQSQPINQQYNVPVEAVPTNNAGGQVYAANVTDAFTEGLATGCNGSGGFQGTAQVTRFDYSSTGQGGVGTRVTLDYAFTVNGTCSVRANNTNQTVPLNFAGDITAIVKRIK